MPSAAASSSLTTPASPPPSAALPGFAHPGGFVHSLEYQRFFVEEEQKLKGRKPGIKVKKLKRKVDKKWLKEYPAEAESPSKLANAAAASISQPSTTTTAAPRAPLAATQTRVKGKPVPTPSLPVVKSGTADEASSSEADSDKGQPLGAHRIWADVGDGE